MEAAHEETQKPRDCKPTTHLAGYSTQAIATQMTDHKALRVWLGSVRGMDSRERPCSLDWRCSLISLGAPSIIAMSSKVRDRMHTGREDD